MASLGVVVLRGRNTRLVHDEGVWIVSHGRPGRIRLCMGGRDGVGKILRHVGVVLEIVRRVGEGRLVQEGGLGPELLGRDLVWQAWRRRRDSVKSLLPSGMLWAPVSRLGLSVRRCRRVVGTWRAGPLGLPHVGLRG